MDGDEGGESDDAEEPVEQSNRNEENFTADDQKLHGDVPDPQDFLESLSEDEELGIRNKKKAEKETEFPPPLPAESSGVGGGGDGRPRVLSRAEGFHNVEVREDEMAIIRGDEFGKSFGKLDESKDHTVNKSVTNRRIVRKKPEGAAGVHTVGNVGKKVLVKQGGGGGGGGGGGRGGGRGVRGGETRLYVSELLWWTTDAEIEAEACKYGRVKELRFFPKRDNGTSKGCCRVEFHDPDAAADCRNRMDGHEFHGRPCAVSYRLPSCCFSDRGTGNPPGRGNRGQFGPIRKTWAPGGMGVNGGPPPPPPPPPLFRPHTVMGHGVEGHNMGMWSDPNMAGWSGEEHYGRRAGESGYYWEEPVVSRPKDLCHHGEGSERGRRDDRDYGRDREEDYVHERSRDPDRKRERDRSEAERERDRNMERERDRDRKRGRSQHRDEKARYVDHPRHKERDPGSDDDESGRGGSSRTHSKRRR